MKKTRLLVLNLFIIEVIFCSNLLAQRCAQVPVSLSCAACNEPNLPQYEECSNLQGGGGHKLVDSILINVIECIDAPAIQGPFAEET